MLSPLGISVPDRTRQAILKLRPPTTRTEVRSLLGLSNTISHYIKNYQEKVAPLYELTSTRKPFDWTDRQEKAFACLKDSMHRLPLLSYFFYKNAKDISLYTDASDCAGGAILMLELQDGSRLPLSYSSYKFPASSLKQSIFRKEFYSLASALSKNQDILASVHFNLYIDSKALYHALINPKVKLTEQLYRLNAFVHGFSYTVKWVPSKCNLADILTRQVGDDIPTLDLSFLSQFQKDLTILGWKEEPDPVVPVYHQRMASSTPQITFWDSVSYPSLRAPCVSFFEEKFPGPPGSGDERLGATSSEPETQAMAPTSSPVLSPNPTSPPDPDAPAEPSLPLDEERRGEDVIQQEITDKDFQFPAHQPMVESVPETAEDPLGLPAALRVFSHLDFLLATQKDEDLSLLIGILTKAQPLPDQEFLKRCSEDFRMLYGQKDLFHVKGGLLYRQYVKDVSSTYLLVVPNELQLELVSRIHVRFGHSGISSTQLAVQRAFYFRRMQRVVRRVILNCSLCLKYKSKTEKAFVGSPLDLGVTRPWESVSVDHFTCGYAPHLKATYSAVLIGVDTFSGFLVAENVKSLEGKETAQALKSIIERYGAPQTIRSDNGTAFRSKEVKLLLDSYGIRHHFAIPYTPTSNGKVERQVQNIKTRLRILLSDVNDKKDWFKYTQTACFAVNMAIKPALGYSPRELFMGAPPFMDGTLVYGSPSTWSGSMAEFIAQREAFFDSINRQKWGLIDKSTPHSDPPDLSPGDTVFLRNFTIQASPNRQLEPKFEGPFTILKKINSVTYKIDKNGQHTVAHISNIRPYDPTADPVRPPQVDAPTHIPDDSGNLTSHQPTPAKPQPQPTLPTRRVTRSMDVDRNQSDLSKSVSNPNSEISNITPTNRPPLPPSTDASDTDKRGSKRARDSTSSSSPTVAKTKSPRISFLSNTASAK